MKFIDDEPINKPQPQTAFINRGNFGDISEYLKIRIRLCDKNGKVLDTSHEQIIGLMVEGTFNIENHYSSPFENSNPEQKLPTLMGQLQSGNWVNTLDSVLGSLGEGGLTNKQKDGLNILQGRSTFTKENSTQVYTATAPIQMSVTLHFEAWEDARNEVEDQLDLLKQWTLPEYLSNDSILASFVKKRTIESVFPSSIPPYVAVYYGGKCYAPMLIQNMSEPLTRPQDSEGNRISIDVQLNLISRTAWDKTDIPKLQSSFFFND